MPSTWLVWRALAVLGALLCVCCTAARPIPNSTSQDIFNNNIFSYDINEKSVYFIKEVVLNKSFEIQNKNNNKSNMGHSMLSEEISTTTTTTTSVSSSSTSSNNDNDDKMQVMHQSNEINLNNSTITSTQSSSTSSTISSSDFPVSPNWTFNTLISNIRAKTKIDNVRKGESIKIKNSVNLNNSSSINNVNASILLLSRADRSVPNSNSSYTGKRSAKRQRDLDRNERSANLSHITGATRKIQLYIKNRFLQILPDGTVNGTHDDTSDYTILHRTSVDIGQIKIQSVATCLFLCMDACGTVYGSPIFSEDCVFNESMEQHHFNTYSSTHHSNARRTLYLALNRHGEPRKIQIPPTRSLGKLATYTKSLTQTVEQARVETLITQNFGPNYIKHGLKQLCDSGQQLRPLTDKKLKPKAKCSLQNKIKKQVTKKKKRRKCRDDEPEGDNCVKTVVNSLGQTTGPGASMQKKRQQQAQKQNVNKCNHNEEDCVNNNLGNNSNNNNNNKKRPIMKKMQRAQSGGPGQKKGKQQQQQQQHVIEIAAIHKLQPNNRNPGGKRNGKAKTTTTTTTPKTPIVESLEELSAEEDDEFEDILIDPHGHNMQFVDDDDTLLNEED